MYQNSMFSRFLNYLEHLVRMVIVFITNFLPVKVIRDDKGRPFLYRYHLFSLTNDGPGICFHHFVKSDPDRGYHDHPWKHALSFILCGGYTERIYNKYSSDGYDTYIRNRWTFNKLLGVGVYHRVMLEENKDAWTIFFFQKRSKTWGMISLDGEYKPMSTSIKDNDGGWWNHVIKGIGLHTRLSNIGNVVSTVDSVIMCNDKILLIKRGKNPYKDMWALPGGRIEQSDDTLSSAAYRELYEETNLSNVNLEYFKTYGDSERDPRGFCLTNVYVGILDNIPENIKAGDDAVDYIWCEKSDILDNNIELAFDHYKIIKEVLSR